jgi:protein-arginine kinase activator protein McsA
MRSSVPLDTLQKLDKIKLGNNDDTHLEVCQQCKEKRSYQVHATYPAKQEEVQLDTLINDPVSTTYRNESHIDNQSVNVWCRMSAIRLHHINMIYRSRKKGSTATH